MADVRLLTFAEIAEGTCARHQANRDGERAEVPHFFAGVGVIDELGVEVPPQRGTVVTQGAS